MVKFLTGLVVAIVTISFGSAKADDWPMLGRSNFRNPVSPEKNPPLTWKVELRDDNGNSLRSAENIKWTAKLGNYSIGDPVVANGLVWIGSNNDELDSNDQQDASVLLCFRESDGKRMYKYVSPRLQQGSVHDWPFAGLSCSPLVERDRLWFTTNRGEIICLDIGPLERGEKEPHLVWKVDMIHDLGIFPRGSVMNYVRLCSVAGYKDWIYVITNNGVDETFTRVPKPQAPSLVCVEKSTGKVVWQDNSPGENILEGQWSSPLVIEIDGQGQVIAPLGDGWLRSFDPATGKLLWEFDINYKDSSRFMNRGRSRRTFFASPVFYDHHVYIGSGEHPEAGDVQGRLCCIDPTCRGDISAELAVDATGHPLSRRRLQAVDKTKGEQAISNPNSGLVWEYTTLGKGFESQMHGLVSQVAIANGLLIAVDRSGLVHCLDAQSGEHHWSCDLLSTCLGSPLIVDSWVYVGDEDGDVCIFRLSADPQVALRKDGDVWAPLSKIETGQAIYASPIYSNGVLYFANTNRTLFAIPSAGRKAALTSRPMTENNGSEAGPSPVLGLKHPADSSAERDRPPRSIFTPTPQDVVDKMLDLANVQRTDVVYDLGSGDGRIVITAARKYGCKAVGYEIDQDLVIRSRQNAKQDNVEQLVTIEHQDLYTANLKDANVVALYLTSKQLEKLLPQLQTLSPGARVVSHEFEIPGLKPDKSIIVESKADGEKHAFYLWTAPFVKKSALSR